MRAVFGGHFELIAGYRHAAEGLLGAARLAHSLRSGRPSLRSGVQRRCATLSNPPCFMSGVRIRPMISASLIAFTGQLSGHAGEGLLGAARLARSLRGRRRCAPAFNVAARRCRTLLVPLSGVRIEADKRWNVIWGYRIFVRGMPAEGFE